jgi:hypothetical protein
VCAHGFTAFLNQPAEVEEIRPRLATAIVKPEAFPQLVMRFGRGAEVEPSPRERAQDVLVVLRVARTTSNPTGGSHNPPIVLRRKV